MTAAKITTGPIFRPVNRYGTVGKNALSGLAVPRIVKEMLTRVGIDAKDYSGHSLRSGLVTAAAMAGVSERIIMLQTGHKNIAVLRRYSREGSVFRGNAAAAGGLSFTDEQGPGRRTIGPGSCPVATARKRAFYPRFAHFHMRLPDAIKRGQSRS